MQRARLIEAIVAGDRHPPLADPRPGPRDDRDDMVELLVICTLSIH